MLGTVNVAMSRQVRGSAEYTLVKGPKISKKAGGQEEGREVSLGDV